MTTTPIDLTPPAATPASGMPTAPPAVVAQPSAPVAPSSGPSAWDHAALVLGAAVLVGVAIVDSFHTLSTADWAAVGAATAALGVKGVTGLRGN